MLVNYTLCFFFIKNCLIEEATRNNISDYFEKTKKYWKIITGNQLPIIRKLIQSLHRFRLNIFGEFLELILLKEFKHEDSGLE